MKGKTTAPNPQFTERFFRVQNSFSDNLLPLLSKSAAALYIVLLRHSFPSPFLYHTANYWGRKLQVSRSRIFELLNELEDHWLLERQSISGRTCVRAVDADFAFEMVKKEGVNGRNTAATAPESMTHDEILQTLVARSKRMK
jgi:hypothetical protein